MLIKFLRASFGREPEAYIGIAVVMFISTLLAIRSLDVLLTLQLIGILQVNKFFFYL